MLLLVLLILVGCSKDEETIIDDEETKIVTEVESTPEEVVTTPTEVIDEVETNPNDEKPPLDNSLAWLEMIPDSKVSIIYDDETKEYYLWEDSAKLFIVESPYSFNKFNGYVELNGALAFIPLLITDFGSSNVVFMETVQDILAYIKQNSQEVEDGIYTLDGEAISTFLALLLPKEIATDEVLQMISNIGSNISLTVIFENEKLTKINFSYLENGIDFVFEYQDDFISKVDILGIIGFEIKNPQDETDTLGYHLNFSMVYKNTLDGINISLLSQTKITSSNPDLCSEREESLNLGISKTETLIEGSFLGANIDGIIVYGETIGSDLKIEFNDKLYEIKLETNVEIPTMIKSDSVTSRSVNLMLFFDRFMNDLSE